MKVNELRIGNLLQYKNTNDIAIVELIHKNHFDCRDEFGTFTPNGNYEAIPLTEEKLLELGAKELKPKRGVLKEFVLKTVRIEMSNSGNFYYKNSKLILQSIHQLQNLYFALTGKELILNA